MNTGFLIVSTMSIACAIIALGIGAYTASVFSSSSTSTSRNVANSFGVWWGALPIILTGGLGIATALQPTVRENPGYILAVFTAVMAFVSFLIALACMIYVGVITFFLYVASALSNNVDVTNLFRCFAASEAFIVLSAILMLVMFIYACILTCVKCCPECCGEGGCAGCETCDEQDTEAGTCGSCDCDDKPKPTADPYSHTNVIGDAPRTPSIQVKNPSPAMPVPATNGSLQPYYAPSYAPMKGSLQPASIQMPSASMTKPTANIGGSTSGLPVGWIAHFDPATGSTYYENTLTNTTTWTSPVLSKGALPEIRA